MKKYVLLISMVGFVFVFASCKKEKTCECITSYSGAGSEGISDVTSSFETEGDCDDGNATVTTGSITMTTTCTEQ